MSTNDELRRAAALAYDGSAAPRVVASANGALAEDIENLARRHGIPVIQDRRLSAALSAVPLGEEVPEELYVAVATVLAYVFKVSGRRPTGLADGETVDSSGGDSDKNPQRSTPALEAPIPRKAGDG